MMNLEQVITYAPEHHGGTPVFAGTHVPVQTLMDCLIGGARLDDYLESYPAVSREQAIAVLEVAFRSIEQINLETSMWMDAPLSGELPPYDWGEAGIPEGQAIEYDPDIGFVFIEEDEE